MGENVGLCLYCGLKSEVGLRKDHRHFRSRLHVIVLKHVWDQLFTVNTIWNIGETGDIYLCP